MNKAILKCSCQMIKNAKMTMINPIVTEVNDTKSAFVCVYDTIKTTA